jgi:tellurite resistance protein
MILWLAMFWLSTSTVVKLRDQLRAAGQKAAVEVRAGEPLGEEATAALEKEFAPFCEAMYLMMSADGDVSIEEREVLSGAMRNLSGGQVDSEHVERMIERATKSAEDDGRDERLVRVAEELSKDKARAEVAFVLAAAIAFADNTIADEENDTLDALAEGLGIDEARADDLLQTVEKDLGVGGTG